MESLIRGKITAPDRTGQTAERSRITERLLAGIHHRRSVRVTAAAGSGKTTAVIDAVTRCGRPVAWLSVDTADAAPGRLLTYLEASVREALPTTPAVATQALGRAVAHPDAAGLLAEALAGQELVVVLDDLERIAEEHAALEVVASFLRYLPAGVNAVVVSRQELGLPHLGADDLDIARLVDADLAFTVDEAEAALRARGRSAHSAVEAVQATGGWVTGVLFEAWRASAHEYGKGGERDPLRDYLSQEIMRHLPPDEREFLVATSLLDEVTPTRAEALELPAAGRRVAKLRDAHLPLSAIGPLALRYHARFREYLQTEFEALDERRQRTWRGAYAELLCEEHRWEEAIEQYLLLGDIAQAEDAAIMVVETVLRRQDFAVVRRWLSRFRRWRIESSVELASAEMMVLDDAELYGSGAECADRLLAMVQRDAGVTLSPELIGVIAWCYFLVGRIDDALHLLSNASPHPLIDIMSFAVRVELSDDPTHYRDRPVDPNTQLDVALARVDLAHGRFERLLGTENSLFGGVRLSRAGALTGLGRLDEAQSLFLSLKTNGWTGVRLWAELMAERGEHREAWSALVAGRDDLAQTGSSLYRMFALLTEAQLALRFRGDTAQGRAVLHAVEAEPTSRRRVRVVEQLHLWRGLAALLDGDSVAAVSELTTATDLMVTWDRLLWLPTAAVYLAEAHWRVGDETRADEAADLALATSLRLGSHHQLTRALGEFPAVLSRRLDLEREADSVWHDLGQSILSTHRSISRRGRHPIVRVAEIGDLGVEVDGDFRELRLLKSVELLSYLAAHGGASSRQEIIDALFNRDNEKSASAYLRMAVNGVKKVVGESTLSMNGDLVQWEGGQLTSEFLELSDAHRQARNLAGNARLELTSRMLERLPHTEFLPGSRSDWGFRQRQAWQSLVADVTQAAAEAAFETGNYGIANERVQEVLRADPYRERAWRLRMRISAALGDGDRVIADYHDCERALAELPATPAESTRRLLTSLRA